MQSSFLIIAVLVNFGVAVAIKNHEMENDFAGLFGPHRRRQGTPRRVEDSLNRRGHHGRRMEGEITVPPLDEEASPFYTAESLDYFKSGMDKEYFEWVNPKEIVAGGTTCGFLKPDLGTTPNLIFPRIEVYVCMRFANIQPASKGNVFVHCGGPGSLSSCSMVDELGEKALDDYNFLTIDQRGMGRSWPTFAHEECTTNSFEVINGTLTAVGPPEFSVEYDMSNVDDVKRLLEPYKRRVFSCWQCQSCDFHLNATQSDGTVKTFHFLEYSGTRQLAEDIERIRMLLNAPAMHVYGISYGTSVFGTYATLFPGSVGLMVLDGNVNPMPDLEYIAYTLGRGLDTRINYALFSCSAKNAEKPGSCRADVDDLPKCVSDLNAALGGGAEWGRTLLDFLVIMFNEDAAALEICTLASDGDADALINLYNDYYGSNSTATERKKQMTGDPASQPTWEEDVYGFPNYSILIEPTTMVQAQDDFSALYNADYFAKKIVEFSNLYNGAGSGTPVEAFFTEWAQGFYWPKGVPLAPIGNPQLTGIVAGQLYDPNTPYVWTQNMRSAFPLTYLLTSQATQHGLTAISPECQQHIIDYFDTGFVQIVDGTVCGADFADESAIVDAFDFRQ